MFQVRNKKWTKMSREFEVVESNVSWVKRPTRIIISRQCARLIKASIRHSSNRGCLLNRMKNCVYVFIEREMRIGPSVRIFHWIPAGSFSPLTCITTDLCRFFFDRMNNMLYGNNIQQEIQTTLNISHVYIYGFCIKLLKYPIQRQRK